MVGVLTVLAILTVSLAVTRIATVALVHTGLSLEAARFQARSAFSGCGYTTGESESIVNHPVRRRIIMLLMLVGNSTIVAIIASLILTAADPMQSLSFYNWILILVLGLIALWLISVSKVVDRWMAHWITIALRKWTDLEIRDYAGLLHLADNHKITELKIEPHDWLADQTLAQLSLSDEGVIVIGIQREEGVYVGAPHGATRIEAGDLLLLYGRNEILMDLDERHKGTSGDHAHMRAVEEQRRVAREQAEHEKTRILKKQDDPEPAEETE